MKITRTNKQYESIVKYYHDSKERALAGCNVCPCCGSLIIRESKKCYTSRNKIESCKHFYECPKCGAAWESDYYETYNPKIGKNLQLIDNCRCPFCYGDMDETIRDDLHLTAGKAEMLFTLLLTTNLSDYLSEFDCSIGQDRVVEVKLDYIR